MLAESLGNTTLVLPPGRVCDSCNNYFARKLEGPFLASSPMLSTRVQENVRTKRGTSPRLEVSTSLDSHGTLYRWRSGLMALAAPVETLSRVMLGGGVTLSVPGRDEAVDPMLLGRFACKVAIGALAARFERLPLVNDHILDAEFDSCRRHARYGEGPVWPVEVRRIHGPNHAWPGLNGWEQRVWEHDFVFDTDGDLLFGFAVFGLEFAVNMFQRSEASYRRWRIVNGAPSLLYPFGVPACADCGGTPRPQQ